MTWQIHVDVNTQYPGMINVAVGGDPDAKIFLWRRAYTRNREDKAPEPRQRVRGVTQMPHTGILNVVDTEPQIDQLVYYEVEDVANHKIVVSSPPIYSPAPDSGKAIIRSVLSPTILFHEVVIEDETDVTRGVTSSVHNVLGREDPIVVSDVVRLESGTLQFLAMHISEAEEIIQVLTPGRPIALRTPCSSFLRDKLFTVTGSLKDVLVRKGSPIRRITVPYTAVSWPDERPDAPIISDVWTYAELDKPTTTARTYDVLQTVRKSYFYLAILPVAP